MQMPHGNSSTEQEARPTPSWRLLLLVLLVLLPVTAVLASPNPAHFPAANVVQDEASVPGHHPSDTPTCHHAGHHTQVSALVTDNREAEPPTPADSGAAMPSAGPGQGRHAATEDAPRAVSADELRSTLPVYLRTLRLRV